MALTNIDLDDSGAAVVSGCHKNQPAYWNWSLTPPMGWNSYDSYGESVTEADILLNAQYMKDHLLPHGWNTIVVDIRWYDPSPQIGKSIKPPNIVLECDKYGRLLPVPGRFPSATAGMGFKPLADRLHGMGLKFGIHIMRGIPRQAVAANSAIEGSSFKAADAADMNSTCKWCGDMWGVKEAAQAGQDYYDSLFRLYALWGVDFVKVDDLSQPYSTAEVEAIRKSIDKCSRPIVFSASPGETPIQQGDHVANHTNMWRICADFWDKWEDIDHDMDLLAMWGKYSGPGHWPDPDMIPLGHLGPRCPMDDIDRNTRFNPDEQRTLMSLLALAPAPLMLGMNLPDLDPATLDLLTNDEVIALNQDAQGTPAERTCQKSASEIWMRALHDGSTAIGLFNRGNEDAEITVDWNALGLSGSRSVRNLWQKKYLGRFDAQLTLPVPKHGAVLLRMMNEENQTGGGIRD